MYLPFVLQGSLTETLEMVKVSNASFTQNFQISQFVHVDLTSKPFLPSLKALRLIIMDSNRSKKQNNAQVKDLLCVSLHRTLSLFSVRYKYIRCGFQGAFKHQSHYNLHLLLLIHSTLLLNITSVENFTFLGKSSFIARP